MRLIVENDDLKSINCNMQRDIYDSETENDLEKVKKRLEIMERGDDMSSNR